MTSSIARDAAGIVDFWRASKRATVTSDSILSGADPSAYNTSDPLRLWIIQLAVIIFTSQILSLGLKKIKQPKVIAEIIGGIFLGPTVMGRVPGFTQHIFPSNSLPFLSLVANMGLVLFLFLVGLEIDLKSIKKNTRSSVIIGLGGMLLPFGVGAGMGKLIYDQFAQSNSSGSSNSFSHFVLFTCVAYSITAFPVLCRILTELKLLDTTVGLCVLSAGVGVDIIGWTLLALVIALVNATTGLTALYVILTASGWTIFLLFPVRIALLWFARKSGSVDSGPSTLFMTITLMLVFASAFFTDVIGVHAIFGGFLAGVIIPREGGLSILIAEKLEDMVAILFLPLYFTLSGLSTNLGLINTGKAWGYVFAIIFTDWCGKFIGSSTCARLAGLKPREAFTVGTFMSCKGLVELVVLNIGHNAGILSTQVFSMMVLDAVVLTFITTPVAVTFYPPHLRVRVVDPVSDPHRQPKHDSEIGETSTPSTDFSKSTTVIKSKSRFLVVLDKFEHLPGLMNISQMLATATQLQPRPVARRPLSVDALRLLELTDRTSAVIMSSATDVLANTDNLLSAYRAFGELNGFSVKTDLSVVAHSSFGQTVGEHTYGYESEMVLVGCAAVPQAGTLAAGDAIVPLSNSLPSDLIRSIFARSASDVGFLLDRRAPSDPVCPIVGRRRIFLPFFGGEDDRCALNLVIQLCKSDKVSAVVVRFNHMAQVVVDVKDGEKSAEPAHVKGTKDPNHTINGITMDTIGVYPDTIYVRANTVTMLQSKVADDMLWETATTATSESIHWNGIRNITFETRDTAEPLRAMLKRTAGEMMAADVTQGRLLTVIGRSRRLATPGDPSGLDAEFKSILEQHGAHGNGGEMRKTIGAASTAIGVSGYKTDMLVVQARPMVSS